MQRIIFFIFFSTLGMGYSQSFELSDTTFKSGDSYTTWSIYFLYDKATIHDSSSFELNKIRDFLANNPTLQVEIQVHTDHQGSQSYGRNLSEDRAEEIAAYLIKLGIDKMRLVPKGYGDSMPIKSDWEEGRRRNRRVVIKIL